MSDDSIEIFDAGEAQTDAEWLDIMTEIGDESGYFERIGDKHCSFFADSGANVLLVSFETVKGVRDAGGGQMPLGYQIAAPRGWSSLTILAKGQTWFRDSNLFGYFDRLIDDAFFEDFDRVVFYGAGMGGYGAAAYSVAAPGCTVLAMAPQATLDTVHAEWDRRFMVARRMEFSSRFGYAPDMVEACDKVFMVYDPIQQVDAVHAAMFRGPHIERLRARHIGRDPQAELARMGILRQVIDAACMGELTHQNFMHLWRARRDSAHYLGRLIGRIQSQNRPARLLQALRVANNRVDHPQLRKALKQVEAKVGAAPASAAAQNA